MSQIKNGNLGCRFRTKISKKINAAMQCYLKNVCKGKGRFLEWNAENPHQTIN